MSRNVVNIYFDKYTFTRIVSDMFYLKYRPQKFSEISKPNDTAVALSNQVIGGKIAHAYLFIGPRGTGKTTTARILAKAINCKNPAKNGDPCDECDFCKAVIKGRHLDLIEIDAASNRGIDDIRSLKEKINLTPSGSRFKVYIIDEVHMLTMEAFNALLKTLEEPPAHAIFILCTTEGHKVPDTIKSRCQVFRFKRATIPQIVEKLESISKAEKAKVAKEDLEKIAKASYGGYRDAETVLQQVIDGSVSVESLVGVSVLENFVKLTNFLIKGKTQGALEIVRGLSSEGVDLTNWSYEYVRYLRDLLYIQAGFDKGVNEIPRNIFVDMEDQAFKLSSQELVKIIECFLKASSEIKGSVIPELPLELAIVESSERPQDFSVGENTDKDLTSSKSQNKDDEREESQKNKMVDVTTASLDSVLERWTEILKEIKPYNHSVEALLRSCKPTSLNKNSLNFEVAYAFHKERLETPKSREIVERVLQEKFGSPIKVKYILKSKEGESLTDKNLVVPDGDVNPKAVKSAIEVFDGGIEI